MVTTLSRRILRFNFDPTWFAHPSRLAQEDLGFTRHDPDAVDVREASTALRAFGLSGRWCFDFDWVPSRLALIASSEVDWVLSQLGILAFPELRHLVVRREDRDWIRALPGSNHSGAASVGDGLRQSGDFRPATGSVKDVRHELKRHGAALWMACARNLGDAGSMRLRLMLDPSLDVPHFNLADAQARVLFNGFMSCMDAEQQEAWSWLR